MVKNFAPRRWQTRLSCLNLVEVPTSPFHTLASGVSQLPTLGNDVRRWKHLSGVIGDLEDFFASCPAMASKNLL